MRKILMALFVLSAFVVINVAQDDEMSMANIRVVHLSSDAGEVDVYVNQGDTLILQEIFDFSEISDWIELEPATYSIAVVPTGGELEDAVLEADLELASGEWFTIAAIGEVEKETLSLQVLEEDYSTLDVFQSRLSIFHALPNYDPVNVLVNDVELIRYLGYPGFWGPDSDGFISFDLLSQTSAIRLEQEDGTVTVELEDVVLGGNRHYFLAIAGVASDPQFVFVSADLESSEVLESE